VYGIVENLFADYICVTSANKFATIKIYAGAIGKKKHKMNTSTYCYLCDTNTQVTANASTSVI